MYEIGKAAQWCRKLIRKMNQDGVRAYAAEASFFLILSFFPFLMLLLSAVQFTPITQEQVLEVIENATPFAVSREIEALVGSIYNHSQALLSWTAIVSVWTAGKGIIGLSDGLNSVYRIHKAGNYVLVRLRAAFYTIFMLAAMIIAIGILVFGYRLQQFLQSLVPLIARYPDVTLALQMGVSLVILVILFLLFYVFLPNERMGFWGQLPGAIFTSVAWAVFSYAFSVYLDFASNMSVIYGGLTTLIVVMLWLYSCMYLFFVGAEINHFIARPELFEAG